MRASENDRSDVDSEALKTDQCQTMNAQAKSFMAQNHPEQPTLDELHEWSSDFAKAKTLGNPGRVWRARHCRFDPCYIG